MEWIFFWGVEMRELFLDGHGWNLVRFFLNGSRRAGNNENRVKKVEN